METIQISTEIEVKIDVSVTIEENIQGLKFDAEEETDYSRIKRYYEPNIINGDSTDLSLIPDNSVALTITSIPYNVDKPYVGYDDKQLWNQYIGMVSKMFAELYRVTKLGGRVAIQVANLNRRPYYNLVGLCSQILEQVGFRLDGDIIWMKGTAGNGTAWGSWLLPSAPSMRDVHEYIIIASKNNKKSKLEKPRQDAVSTITKAGFLKSTMSVWYILPESDKDHPAVFPSGIPHRLINLYTYTDDVVLDICAGRGTTIDVGVRLGRKCIGYEISEKYFEMMKTTIASTMEELGEKVITDYTEKGWINSFQALDQSTSVPITYYFEAEAI